MKLRLHGTGHNVTVPNSGAKSVGKPRLFSKCLKHQSVRKLAARPVRCCWMQGGHGCNGWACYNGLEHPAGPHRSKGFAVRRCVCALQCGSRRPANRAASWNAGLAHFDIAGISYVVRVGVTLAFKPGRTSTVQATRMPPVLGSWSRFGIFRFRIDPATHGFFQSLWKPMSGNSLVLILLGRKEMSIRSRIFSERIMQTTNVAGANEWYCLTREALLGPYRSQADADLALASFIRSCQGMGQTGGREELKSYRAHRSGQTKYPAIEPLI